MIATPVVSRLSRLFCFGFGYSAEALARRLKPQGWAVAGTSQDGGGARHVFSRRRPLTGAGLAALGEATHVLISIPPDGAGDPALDVHRARLAAAPHLSWIGYLSTTGVYGDCGGALVDESAPLKPTAARSEYRVAAERAWLDFGAAHGMAVTVFRLAGIYGPGRSALDRVRLGDARRIDKPGHLFGRIHVDDIALALERAIARPSAGAIYNVADDEPAANADVIAFACQLVGLDPPPAIPFAEAAPEMSDMALSFWRDNRRIDNRRIKRALALEWQYPSYREGLLAIRAAEGQDVRI